MDTREAFALVDLADSDAKIEQANEHIRYLATYIAGMVDSRPYRLVRHQNPPGFDGGNVFFEVTPDKEAIQRHLTRIGIIVGEVVYHLRSSLNHLVYRLVTHTPSGKITTKTEFPIFIDRKKYKTASKPKIQGVPAAAATLIEQAQPYHRHGIQDPLWLVHDLSVTDKHHILLVVTGIVNYPSPPRVANGQTIYNRIYVPFGDRTAIPAVVAPEMDVNTKIPLEVVFTEPSILQSEPVVPRLKQFVESVRFVVDQFR